MHIFCWSLLLRRDNKATLLSGFDSVCGHTGANEGQSNWAGQTHTRASSSTGRTKRNVCSFMMPNLYIVSLCPSYHLQLHRCWYSISWSNLLNNCRLQLSYLGDAAKSLTKKATSKARKRYEVSSSNQVPVYISYICIACVVRLSVDSVCLSACQAVCAHALECDCVLHARRYMFYIHLHSGCM